MYNTIKKLCDTLVTQFENIPSERKLLLEKISEYISKKNATSKPINLIYICTHNSRRSHFGQIWATVAANYYSIKNVNSFSGGTEATAFNINAINALQNTGFTIKKINQEANSIYHVFFDDNEKPVVCFSKVYDDAQNPSKDFAAIMTCSEAEENCPFIPNVDLRIATTYNDPKEFDNTPLQSEKYKERCLQIASETLYVFSKL
ncbi:MAG: protein-tyrosine-phosphatase [Bacteroidota bacterium]|nr:protein-tyrosine-phosphatase [Bacteroidota bacterium]